MTHRIFTSHRTRVTVTFRITQPAYTHWTPLGSVKALHDHSVFGAKTNFTNSLLQDISIFTGYDTTLLEDWLIDIETANDLTMESRTKLAQAKLKGLTFKWFRRGLRPFKLAEPTLSSAPHEWGAKHRRDNHSGMYHGLPNHHSPCWKMLQSPNWLGSSYFTY